MTWRVEWACALATGKELPGVAGFAFLDGERAALWRSEHRRDAPADT